jgi:hypothetical protein
MSEDKQRTHGQRLSDINRDIVELENLIGLLSLDDRATDDKKIRSMVRMHRKGKSMRAGFKAEAIDNLDNLKALRKMMLAENGPPKEIKCPHCGYDGELDKDHPDNGGFRILQPILEPRLVLGWDGSKMSISDPVDSYDAFHGIAEPGHVDCLDSEDVTEGIREMRAALKGKWLFLCGRDECLGYFDASEWVERAHLEYGEVHGNQSAWTQ